MLCVVLGAAEKTDDVDSQIRNVSNEQAVLNRRVTAVQQIER
jgi:hypothetical protein